ncbi:hypothetical protein BHE74_00004567 [Ensete ventricosum]|uniref:Uncharacterized protein n=1 Tax=Ensete ventricosum TaxID=4639 RepID=A0A426YQJ7_ENSVE|nr:hypothetical protein B296_00049472 [Ensete ventricosum]RWW30242.1 hypothetical protein GW17_00005186 [Ensete ventricosum]RWW86648.1 hypothetical protein BHE74_00004567 [Ensete ventricosum]RZR81871.1 hypothetical protein BHM03_00008177 [Ensete ventricosum]
MRFKKGNKVEVWSRRELASGSWWSAEIISGNGHNYSVRYDGYPTDSSDVKSGDVVEVFDNNSWKLAEVLMVFDKKYCSVRLIGSSREFRTHNSHIRRHLSWQDEQWVVIHKESGKQHGGILNSSSRGEKFGDRKPQSCVEMVNFAEKSRFPIGSHDFPDNTRWVLPRGMKKRTLDLSIPAEMCYDGRRKTRAVEKDGKCHRIITKHPIQCFEKVDAVASTGRLLGEKYIRSYSNNRTIGSYRIESGSGLPNSDKHNCEPSDAESTSSSVGSCSPSSSPCRSLQHHITYPSQELYSQYDHAETCCDLDREPSISWKDELQADIHELELNAYRSTLIALYASGPISWEQEALMTNLRLMLNISNDEHLVELRNLIHFDMATRNS